MGLHAFLPIGRARLGRRLTTQGGGHTCDTGGTNNPHHSGLGRNARVHTPAAQHDAHDTRSVHPWSPGPHQDKLPRCDSPLARRAPTGDSNHLLGGAAVLRLDHHSEDMEGAARQPHNSRVVRVFPTLPEQGPHRHTEGTLQACCCRSVANLEAGKRMVTLTREPISRQVGLTLGGQPRPTRHQGRSSGGRYKRRTQRPPCLDTSEASAHATSQRDCKSHSAPRAEQTLQSTCVSTNRSHSQRCSV